MASADIDKMLREMAQVRGLKLVKSRRRKAGGDFGRYGLKDAKTDKACFGIGDRGLEATAKDVETYLRGQTKAEWKRSLIGPVAAPKPAARRAKRRLLEAEEPAPRRPVRKVEARTNEPPKPVRKVQAKAKEPPPAKPVKREAPQPKVELVIREAKGSDARAIAALMDAPPTSRRIAAAIAQLADEGKPVLVAEEKGVIGVVSYDVMAALQHDAPMGRIVLLTTARQARRRGVGGKLLEQAEARLGKLGCETIEVVNAIEISNANSFLRGHGYDRNGYRFARGIKKK